MCAAVSAIAIFCACVREMWRGSPRRVILKYADLDLCWDTMHQPGGCNCGVSRIENHVDRLQTSCFSQTSRTQCTLVESRSFSQKLHSSCSIEREGSAHKATFGMLVRRYVRFGIWNTMRGFSPSEQVMSFLSQVLEVKAALWSTSALWLFSSQLAMPSSTQLYAPFANGTQNASSLARSATPHDPQVRRQRQAPR